MNDKIGIAKRTFQFPRALLISLLPILAMSAGVLLFITGIAWISNPRDYRIELIDDYILSRTSYQVTTIEFMGLADDEPVRAGPTVHSYYIDKHSIVGQSTKTGTTVMESSAYYFHIDTARHKLSWYDTLEELIGSHPELAAYETEAIIVRQ
ncbi:MAG: hypothetical protein RLN76_00990 [Phycisphaeraceae bacterium]